MKKLLEAVSTFPQTQFWNDSCSASELEFALANGAVGATTNPVIVLNVLKKELSQWEDTIKTLITENPSACEDEIAWQVIEKMGTKAGALLYPKFVESKGKKGRISFQTNAKYYNNAKKLIEHGLHLGQVIENAQVKLPTSKAGIEAFEELTYQGISINATVSFTVSQAIAVAEAVERGLKRRVAENLPIETMNPVCTIMAGRVDDYLKDYLKKSSMLVEPEILEHAGEAVVKHAYTVYKNRGYRTTLLVAAYRNPYHFFNLLGGNIIHTIPYANQLKYNDSDFKVENTLEQPIPQDMLDKLMAIDEFRKAYDIDGLKPAEFEHYGAFLATMKQFLNGYDELCQLIRKYMIV